MEQLYESIKVQVHQSRCNAITNSFKFFVNHTKFRDLQLDDDQIAGIKFILDAFKATFEQKLEKEQKKAEKAKPENGKVTYSMFVQQEKERIKATQPTLKPKEITALVKEAWQQKKEADKQAKEEKKAANKNKTKKAAAPTAAATAATTENVFHKPSNDETASPVHKVSIKKHVVLSDSESEHDD